MKRTRSILNFRSLSLVLAASQLVAAPLAHAAAGTSTKPFIAEAVYYDAAGTPVFRNKTSKLTLSNDGKVEKHSCAVIIAKFLQNRIKQYPYTREQRARIYSKINEIEIRPVGKVLVFKKSATTDYAPPTRKLTLSYEIDKGAGDPLSYCGVPAKSFKLYVPSGLPGQAVRTDEDCDPTQQAMCFSNRGPFDRASKYLDQMSQVVPKVEGQKAAPLAPVNMDAVTQDLADSWSDPVQEAAPAVSQPEAGSGQ